MKRKLILTFDLEFWHNSHFLKCASAADKTPDDGEIEKATGEILAILKTNGHRATFFVLGELAEKFPELVKKIKEQGHEIASHGHTHALLNCSGEDLLEEEVRLSCQALEKATGQKPEGFRAACFSLKNNDPRTWEVLKESGLKYDSSLHPLKSFQTPPVDFKEIPCSLGGFYFRLLPLPVFLFLAKLLAKTETPVIYLHPHELFSFSPRIASGSWWKRKLKYWGTKNALKKFEKMAESCEFISVKDSLESP